MPEEKYKSGGTTYTIAVNPAPADGKKYPMVMVLHGNFGLKEPYGHQILSFAEDLAKIGYATAVPRYYEKDPLEPVDSNPFPHVQTLEDALAYVASRSDADPSRVGLVGYSLGGGIVMTYLAQKKPAAVKALVDFFGRTKDNHVIEAGAPSFPPTIIFQDTDDQVVKVIESRNLKSWLPNTPNYELHEYTDPGSAPFHHGFAEGQAADLDSRKRAAEWLKKHLPPTGT
jgi:carboxymethylenebutenolidase